jgi:hypothetical protein
MIATPVSATREHLEEAFSQGEANMNLEGFHPETDPSYLALKADVLDGKINFDEAIDAAVLSVSRKRRNPAA